MKFEILAQLFGIGAITSSIIIYSRKDRRNLLRFKAIQDICWGIHYLLLACYSAAASSGICFTRSFVFYNSEKKWAKSRLWVVAYIAFYLVSAVMTWQNIFSILPACASCVSTVAFYRKNPAHTKALQIIASLITLSYNILQSHSLSVYLGVSLTISTSVISLITTYRSQKSQK